MVVLLDRWLFNPPVAGGLAWYPPPTESDSDHTMKDTARVSGPTPSRRSRSVRVDRRWLCMHESGSQCGGLTEPGLPGDFEELVECAPCMSCAARPPTHAILRMALAGPRYANNEVDRTGTRGEGNSFSTPRQMVGSTRSNP